jgi:carbamoyl-phosphate synthase small subunit
VVVLDCGVKYNILRCLEAEGCEVIVVPADLPMNRFCPGLLTACFCPTVRANRLHCLICGHRPQLLEKFRSSASAWTSDPGTAVGGRTEKLKFGHHGINQP